MGPPLQTGALLAFLQPYHMTSKEPGCLLQGCRGAVYVQPRNWDQIQRKEPLFHSFFLSLCVPLLHLVVERLNVKASRDVFPLCYINNLRLWDASEPGGVIWSWACSIIFLSSCGKMTSCIHTNLVTVWPKLYFHICILGSNMLHLHPTSIRWRWCSFVRFPASSNIFFNFLTLNHEC